MRKIAIHLDNVIGPQAERMFEAGNIGFAQAVFLLAVQHVDMIRVSAAQTLGDVARPIRRIIIHHQDVQIVQGQRSSLRLFNLQKPRDLPQLAL
jgi:hypothetical protein